MSGKLSNSNNETIKKITLYALQDDFQSKLQSNSNTMSKLLIWLTIIGTAILIPNILATFYGIPYLPLSSENDFFLIIASLILSTVLGTIIVFKYINRWFKDLFN